MHTISALTQHLEWAAQFAAPSGTTLSGQSNLFTVVAAPDGGTIHCGGFNDSVDIGFGNVPVVISATGVSGDVVIFKLDSNKNLLWYKLIQSHYLVVSRDISLDAAGNIIISGDFRDSTDFDPGSGAHVLVSTPITSFDSFVLKLDPNGSLLWVKQLSSTSTSVARELCTDSEDNILVSGNFSGIIDCDPDSGSVDPYTCLGIDPDVYIVKLDTNGDLIWANAVHGPSNNQSLIVTDIESGLNNEIYFGVAYSGDVDFDPGNDTINLNGKFALVKYHPNGSLNWAKNIETNNTVVVRDIEMDNYGHLYINGVFSDTADFDLCNGANQMVSEGTRNGFIAKYDTNAILSWAQQISSHQSSWMSDLKMCIGQDEQLYVAGAFTQTVYFSIGGSTESFVSNGFSDLAIASFDTSGSTVWSKSFGSIYEEQVPDLTADDYYNIYMHIYGSINYDLDPGPNYVKATNRGAILKFGECQNPHFNGISTDPVICLGDTLTLSIDSTDSLYSAQQWKLFAGSCSGISIDSNQTGVFNIIPDSNTMYYMRPEGGCMLPFQCDTIMVTVSLPVSDSSIENVCFGRHFTYPDGSTDSNIIESIIHLSNLFTQVGCDSIIYTTINIDPISTSSDTLWVCSGDSLTLANGLVLFNLQNDTHLVEENLNAFGCDSIHATYIKVRETSESFITAQRCEKFYWEAVDSTFRESTFYTETVHTVYGCDSIIHLTLTLSEIEASVSPFLHFSLAAQPEGADNYQWLNCDMGMATIYNETQQTFYPIQNGNYAAVVGVDSCIDTSECQYISVVGMDEYRAYQPIHIYPNPTHSDMVTIHGEIATESEIQFMDISGRLVLTFQAEGPISHVDISILEAGTYTVFIGQREGVLSAKRLVITR